MQHILDIQQQKNDDGSIVTLRLVGTINFATVSKIRETAFAAMGEHPSYLYLDLRAIAQVEIYGIQTIVTITRVARLLNVQCLVLPSSCLREVLTQTGMDAKLKVIDESFVPPPIPTRRILPEPGVGRPSRKALNSRYERSAMGTHVTDYA